MVMASKARLETRAAANNEGLPYVEYFSITASMNWR